MSELLSCPFCGGVPKTSHRPESEAAGGGHKAFVVCYCDGYASTAHQMGHAGTVQAAIAEAVEKWNTRAQASQGGEAVEVVARIIDTPAAVFPAVELTQSGVRISGTHDLMTVAQHQRILAAATHPADQVAEPGAELVALMGEVRKRCQLPDWARIRIDALLAKP